MHNSLAEKGTLRQLQVLICRTNLPKKVKDNPTAIEDFLDLVLDAHIVAATAAYYNLTSIDERPSTTSFDRLSREKSWDIFKKELEKLVRQLAMHFVQQPKLDVQQPKQGDVQPAVLAEAKIEMDGVFDYASNILGMGLMSRNFYDASREGDGTRILRCWKFFLLHFKADGR